MFSVTTVPDAGSDAYYSNMGRRMLRSLLVPLVIVAVAVSAGRTGGTCCAAMFKRTATTTAPARPSCCHRHGSADESCPGDAQPLSSPCYPGAPCCVTSAPSAQPEVAPPKLDGSRGTLAAIAAIVFETADADGPALLLRDFDGAQRSAPPLRILLCNWRN